MTVRHSTDPPAGPRTAAAEGDAQQWQDGYRRGFAAGADVGSGQGLAEVKALQHDLYDELAHGAEAERQRWTVRGERRTRQTFGRPHPDDYTGGPVTW